MKKTKKAQKLLEQMAQIEVMERGRICQMKNRNHFNHQTWKSGKNVVHYLKRQDIPDLQKAIDGYKRFNELTQKYVDEIIRLYRIKRNKIKKKTVIRKK